MPRPGECIESFLSRPMAEGQRDVDARPGLWGEARLENCAAFFFLSTRLSCFFRNARERKPNGRCQFRVFENGSSLPPRDQRSLHWMSKYSRAVIRGQSGRGNKTAWRRRPARHRIIYFLMTKALPRASLSTPPCLSLSRPRRRFFFFFFPLLTQPLFYASLDRFHALPLFLSASFSFPKKPFQANHHRERLLAQPHAGKKETLARRRGTASGL